MNAPINPSSSPIYNTRTTGIFLPTPQVQSSLTYVNSYPNTIGIIVGVILVVVVVVTLTTVIVVLAIRTIRKKNKKYLNRGASMIGNAAYNGTTFENLNARYSTHTGGTYEYAKHGVQNGHKNTEVHAAAAMTINELEASCRPSTVYIMSMAAQRNEAYGTAQTNDYEDMEYSYIRYY